MCMERRGTNESAPIRHSPRMLPCWLMQTLAVNLLASAATRETRMNPADDKLDEERN